MQEIWVSIEGFEGLYEVSNMGNVKALERVVENNGGLQHKHERILGGDNAISVNVTLARDGGSVLHDNRVRCFGTSLIDGISSVGSNNVIFDAGKCNIATEYSCAKLIVLLNHCE